MRVKSPNQSYKQKSLLSFLGKLSCIWNEGNSYYVCTVLFSPYGTSVLCLRIHNYWKEKLKIISEKQDKDPNFMDPMTPEQMIPYNDCDHQNDTMTTRVQET